MEGFDTMTDALTYLRSKGYTLDFNLTQDFLECENGKYHIPSNDFRIDEVFRFEGNSDPADESIVYAISSEDHKLKGVLVNGYGIYTEPLTNDMLETLGYR
jgi:hypothetical protein